ncbi:MAG: hypothetical protein A2Y67_01825 [Candidatus Buchananbacteria bacterium RBG_13_39_9]|uniref:Uncharacterized protein n=1 Tax=Candidatus Buchananbacteria bacterium RBG_13_39_9 TaxID=1797531 RepID=A0A1G1XQI5_9BACT|nr:MAG: hypothetical protein A2Y67_01825 [Candidatus Buchananbacteria bacterium RBG_13_39_9]
MPKNPNAKGAARKKRAEKIKEQTEKKYAARGSSSNGSSKPCHHGGLAVPAKKMEQMSNQVLETIFLNQEPGWQLAERILEKRYKQADKSLSRMRAQQFQQPAAA